PVGFLVAGNTPLHPDGSALPIFSGNRNLEALIKEHHISIVAVANHVDRTRELVQSFFAAIPLGATIVDFPRFYEAVEGKVPVSLISETWFLENLINARRPKYDLAKRLIDLTLTLLLGALALILLPFIAAAIVLSTPRDILAYRTRRARRGDGMVFFRQERIGKNGRPFEFLKFRSQVLGAERYGSEKGTGPTGASPSGFSPDPRAYPVGTLLRKTYLDELPQLWNIIKGDMSFVGPRPERPEFVAELEGEIPFYRTRELVLPGITGWAQINMQNDASVSDAPEKIQYDLYYIKHRSIALDLTVLLKTALKLLQRSGR
ncbi:MAG: sugar transferase, partial [bacterium]|nr:sugar transferase [bacterium]